MMRQFELVELVKSYDPNPDEDALNRAYVYSMKAHGAQLRASGDPYFSHPVEVAGILAEMKLDGASIVTGLLHDTLEDTDATRDELARRTPRGRPPTPPAARRRAWSGGSPPAWSTASPSSAGSRSSPNRPRRPR